MGLFSRDTVVTVASVIYPLGEEPTKIPDVIKSAVIAAGFKSEDRSDAIDAAIYNGSGVKLQQGWAYASSRYYAGLPVGFPPVHLQPNDPLVETLVQEYLDALYPGNVVTLHTYRAVYQHNVDTIVRQQIEADYNYDFVAEAVYSAVGAVDVDAILVYVPLPQDRIAHPNEFGYQLTFTNPDTSEEVIDEWYPNSLIAGETTYQNHIIMEFSLDSDPATTASYMDGGPDPRLNLYLRTLTVPERSTFPAIVIKKNNVYIDDDDFMGTGPWEDTEAYITSKGYARRLGLNMDDIIALVKDNEDEDKIDYAFIQPGTYVNSPTQVSKEYHWNYFHRLYLTHPDNQATYEAWVTANQYPPHDHVSMNNAFNCPAQSIRILDPDDEKATVNIEIGWRYMTYEEISGTITDEYEIECGDQEIITTRWLLGRAGPQEIDYDVTELYLRKRLTDTTYAELMIKGLWHENYVYKTHTVQSGVWDMFNDPEGDFGTGFLIPLENPIFRSLSARGRLQLAQEAHNIIFNCYKVTKEKWYQTGIFKVVLAVISIVIVVLSFGTLAPAIGALYGTIYASLAVTLTATVAAAVAALVTALVVVTIAVGVQFAAKEAGEWAAEQWGPVWGAIVQIATTIVLTMGIGAAAGSLGFTIPPVGLAEQVLNGTSMILAGLSTYTEAEYKQLAEEQKKWNDYIGSPENPMVMLENQMKEWFPEDWVQDVAKNALFGPKETLDQFLGRTLTLVDGLTYRLTLPIHQMVDLTLTTRLP